jgi:hypothetical protein
MRIALPDSFEVQRVQIQPNDARSDAAVNVIESVSASDSQDRDRRWAAASHHFGEKIGESAQLLNFRRVHVLLVLRERYG